MTQSIDRPSHRQNDAYQQNGGYYVDGYGRPMPGYGQPQFVPPQNPVPRSNGIATGGLVVAIIGALFSFIPFIGTVAWVLAPVGLVLSAVGLARSGKRGAGRGASIAGIVLSIVALVMCIVYTVSFTNAVASGVSNVQQQSAAVHSVTYKVTTAKKTHVTATYSQSQNGNLASASVMDTPAPWSANAQVSGFMGPNVTASLSPDIHHTNRSDTITCTIVEDGVQVAQNSATGPQASVSCMK